MQQNRSRKVEEIFQSALVLAPKERLSYVYSQTEDPELQREIENRLAEHEAGKSILSQTQITDEDTIENDRMIGQRLGAFELKKEIGRGGMGTVYLAERADGEFSQKVAVKLIKRGMDSDFIVRRFRHERQILANLNHPNIANLLDGGTTGEGLPYFVMEYVEGDPLYKYCDKNKLNTSERLQIFEQICSAAQAAHERGIIHRDIKPGNIVVTAQGVPKLLDFGIAKVLNPDLIHESINPTSTLMRMMTLDYASPEQIRGDEITPASDIYGLGILLYELLTGHKPYDFSKGRAPHDVSRVICEVMPEIPSRSVSSGKTLLPMYAAKKISAKKAAELRGESVEGLRLKLTDNLDRLIMKAISKAPQDRFASIKDFAADVSRYLNGENVLADPLLSANVLSPRESTEKINFSKSIAVLPFRLLNVPAGDAGEKFIGIGLADALITRLSNIRSLSVRPTSAVLRFGEKHSDPFSTGRELGVEYILEGHIQKFGTRIRVSVQLLNVREQTTVWAERFDENYTDVLQLEDAISLRAAEALIPHLTEDERENLGKRGTKSPQAFESYLRGRFHLNTFTEEGFAKAFEAYNEAIRHDSNYAAAYAGIADYYNRLGLFGILPARQCFQSAVEAATKAVQLDRELSEARAALGFAALGKYYDWRQSETACGHALKLDPNNPTAHVWSSVRLFMESRFDEGLKHAGRAIEIDPMSPFNQFNLGWGFYCARRFEESIEQFRRLISMTDSQYPLAFYGLSAALRGAEQFDKAIEASERALSLDDESALMRACLAQAFAAAGKQAEAEEAAERLSKLSRQKFVSPYQIAVIHALAGENDEAFAGLEKSFEEREAMLAWLGADPVFDAMREDARFAGLLERTGNPAFYREITTEIGVQPETSADKIQATDSDTGAIKESETSASRRRSRFSKSAFAAIGLLAALAFATFFAVRTGWQPQAEQNRQNAGENKSQGAAKSAVSTLSIAVLPFSTVDAETDDEQYLGVGTADLVTSKLSQITEINLRSASSVRRYLKSDKSPLEIGRELAVDYVVSGTVERKADTVEIKLGMTEIASGRVVWSETFNEKSGDLFALQDSISELIVKSLSLQLSNTEKQNLARHFTENGEAQQLYVAGRFHFGKRSVQGLRSAISLFKQAIQIDPNFALAYTGLADCYALLNWYEEPQPPDAWSSAKQAAMKAVALDNNLAEAHASLAFIKFHFEKDYQSSEEEFRRAIALKPNYATAHQWYAFLLSSLGRHSEAITVMRRAEELEPRSAVITNAVANVLFIARLYDESIAQVNRSLEIDPSSVGAHVILRWNYEKKGMADEALAVYKKETAFAGDTPTSRAKLAHVLAAVGDKKEALNILQKLTRDKQLGQITPYEIGVIYALLDDKTKSIEWLKKAKDSHAVGFSFVNVDPLLDNVRGDPQFQALVK
ncbi:MAG: serine/threonine protein kinase with repeat [Acidobacteria bacterium]|nr:serine/threonine protein kinase with repeat [Acidobacteriota bacterium]